MEDNKEIYKKKSYNNLVKVNATIKFVGLSAVQFFAVFIIVAFSIIITMSVSSNYIVQILVIAVEILPVAIYASKASKEHKKGNSNYFNSLSNYLSMPKKIVDEERIFSYLKK